MQNFNGDLPVKLGVMGLINHSHSTFADFIANFVASVIHDTFRSLIKPLLTACLEFEFDPPVYFISEVIGPGTDKVVTETTPDDFTSFCCVLSK